MNNIINETKDNNIAKYGIYTMIINSRIMDNTIREAVRVIDIQTVELNYIISKYIEYYNLIDIEARNTFKKGLFLLALKYCYRFNMHRTRNNTINGKKTNT